MKLREEDINTTKQTVNRVIRKFKSEAKISHDRKPIRKSKLNVEHYDFIDHCYCENDEYSAAEIQKLMKDKFDDIDISVPQIKKVRRKLGWRQAGPRYCQAIRPINCEKRLDFANKCLSDNETFDDVVFTDESTIEINRHAYL